MGNGPSLRGRTLPESFEQIPTGSEIHEAGQKEGWEQETFSKKMIKKFESEVGRFLYGMRMGTVEPVFANLRHMLGLDRFALRGKAKVNI